MRTDSAIKNSSFAIFQKIVDILLSFVFRTVLIKTLGNTYLGLSGLFTNIFSFLSVAELGISSSIVYLLYEPLSKKDTKKTQALLNLYSKFFNFLGIFILIMGLVLIPILPIIIKEYNTLEINLIPIYILTLLNIVSSYFLSYRRALLEADQKSYISSSNYSIFSIITTILKIFILLLFKNYNMTLVITLVMTIASNIVIYIKTNKIYSFLPIKNNPKVDKKTKKELLKRMGASSFHQIGNIVLTSTDNIIISTYLGVLIVGKYSNYLLISNMIYSTFSLIFCSITANVGNLKIEKTEEESMKVFNKLFFLNYLLYFVACTVFGSMINNMIGVWIGNEYILNTYTVILITISLYVQGMRHVVVTFLNSSGLNYNTRYKSVFEIIINLALSIVLCKLIGLPGIIIGTIISLLFVSSWYEPYILFKHWFKIDFKKYYFKYILFFFIMLGQTILLSYINNLIVCSNFIIFLFLGASNVILSIIVFLIIFNKTEEFKYYMTLFKSILKKIKGVKIK